MWGAADVTLDFTSNTDWKFPTTKVADGTENSYTNGGYTIKLGGGTSGAGYGYNTGYLIMGKSGCYLTLPAFPSAVEKIVVTGRSGASGSVKQNIYVGETAVSTETTGATGSNTYNINSSYQAAGNVYTLKVTSAYNTQVTKIEIYYVKEKTDPTITFNNGSVNVGKTLDLSTLFTSNSDGAVTYSITDGDSYASIDGSILTGNAVGNVTVQASQAASSEYNAKTATATITVNAALTLSSIAITTAPTKTTYTEGETFDATGMVVTATYSDESTDDVTALCTWTPDGALTTSDAEITVSYTENAVTKTTTQDITVNAYVQPTDVEITLNNAFFGSAGTGNINDASLEGSQDRVTVTINKNDGNKLYVNASQIRLYNKNTLVLTAPSGFVFTEIDLVEPASDKAWAGSENTSTPTGYDDSSKSWTGASNSVTITFGGTCRMVGLNITLAEAVPVTITDAEYATYVNATKDLDFSATGITVYTATAGTTSVTLNEVASGKVPANTPVVLYKAGAEGTAVNVPVAASADAIAGTNDLAVSDGTVEGNGSTIYALAKKSGVVGFYLVKDGESIPSGKAYLTIASGGAPEFLGFSFGETTDLSEKVRVNSEKFATAPVYNLNGQRVAQPTKGLYILNGRKVVIK